MNRTSIVCVCCMAVLLLAACEEPTRPGEIAVVNGTPITLKQVQAAHDSLVPGGDSPSRSLEEIRQEYGEVLSDLIVQELVLQELERKNLEVTPQELQREEEIIRADFPPDEFERMLLEESVDVDLWRESLRRRLSMGKFFKMVLRKEAALSQDEVEAYYRAHQDDFKMPEVIHFLQLSGLMKDQIAEAGKMFQENGDAALVQAAYPNLTLREVRMRVDRLAPQQVAGLAKLKKLQVSEVKELNGEFFSMVLLEREAPRTLSQSETYARIEGVLMEDKLQKAFDAWLAGRLAKSTIKVSKHLLPENLQ